MDSKTIDRLRQTLIERRDDLNRELQHLEDELRDLSVEQDAEGGGTGNHFADDGSSLGEQERISTVEANFRDQLSQIEQAFERMDAGTYGICKRCGKPIDEDRLEALPYTAFCIDCQKFLEQQAELFGAHVAH